MLVQDQSAAQEADELVERCAEVVDVVEREAGENGVERARIVERLDRGPPEDRPLGRLGIDRDHLVARVGKGERVRLCRSRPRAPGAAAPRCEYEVDERGQGVEVTQEEARRIAVRAQLLDGSAEGVLDTIRRLGFLQIDPISTVAPPQYLVLWSRLGPYDRTQLDRLLLAEALRVERVHLAEGGSPAHPGGDARALGSHKRDQWARGFLQEQAGLRRYVLRELGAARCPHASWSTRARFNERTVWWGTRSADVDARAPASTWANRRRRAGRDPPVVGSRRARLSEGRDRAGRGRDAPAPTSVSGRWV